MSKSLEFERRLQCRIHADVSLAHVGGTADLVCVVCEHQEAVRLRAEGAGLERQTDKYNERGECLTCGSSASCEHDDLGTGFTALAYVESLKVAERERDELRAQIAALRAQLAAQQAVIESLRAAVSEYFDILEAQQREVLGDDAQGIIEEMEQSTTGTRRLAEARRTVYVLLGRTAQAAQSEGEPRA